MKAFTTLTTYLYDLNQPQTLNQSHPFKVHVKYSSEPSRYVHCIYLYVDSVFPNIRIFHMIC